MAVVALTCMLAACSGDVEPVEFGARFQQVQVISAYPAKKQGDGSWARVCGAELADGLITNVAFLSSQRTSSNSGADGDVSIRPFDVIDNRVVAGGFQNDIDLSSPTHVQLQLDCINPASTAGNDCEGAVPATTLETIRYVAHTPARGHGHNVLLLVDQSGSIGGLVNDVTYKEARIPNPLPVNFGEVASDRTGVRLSAARRLTGILNTQDRLGVLAFGESLIMVPCSEATDDNDTDLTTCFGSGVRDIWMAGIEGLQATSGGRSNLWAAVQTAYDFLRELDDPERSNHIIVLTDGPDTCAGENRESCATPCTTADYAQLLDTLESDQANPNAPKISVNFVQFESLGYPGRDPRQVEVSCITGGHYQYINSNSFPRLQPAAFQEALDTAVANVRFALMGHWELAASVPAYSVRVPTGNLYALQGTLTLRASSKLVSSDRPFPFGVGLGQGAPNAQSWDRRPTVRKPCGGFADCGAASEPRACQVVCSPETLVCVDGAREVELPDLMACDGGGFCCGGECSTSGSCAACSSN